MYLFIDTCIYIYYICRIHVDQDISVSFCNHSGGFRIRKENWRKWENVDILWNPRIRGTRNNSKQGQFIIINMLMEGGLGASS